MLYSNDGKISMKLSVDNSIKAKVGDDNYINSSINISSNEIKTSLGAQAENNKATIEAYSDLTNS